jgi:hypothetical protein
MRNGRSTTSSIYQPWTGVATMVMYRTNVGNAICRRKNQETAACRDRWIKLHTLIPQMVLETRSSCSHPAESHKRQCTISVRLGHTSSETTCVDACSLRPLWCGRACQAGYQSWRAFGRNAINSRSFCRCAKNNSYSMIT